MTIEWNQDECSKILEVCIKASKALNAPIECAFQLYHEFIPRPRRHSSIEEALSEFIEEVASEDFEEQEGESTESVTTPMKLESKGNNCEDFKADKVVETIETPRSEEDVHKEDEKSSLPKELNTRDLGTFMETEEKLQADSPKEEQPQKKPQQQRDDPRSLPIPCSIGEVNFKGAPHDLDSNTNPMSLYFVDRLKEAHDKEENQEKQLVEIETDQRNASSVRDEDFYKGAESQPMKFQEQDIQQKEQPSNKAEEKSEIDKVIDMICALFATVKLKRVWKQYPLFLKFLGFLTKKRKKTDDIFHLSYKTP
ncbi:hypothetical protein QL285_081950 [Trifolium repens]|nr:hypothetical protein QL285_081950 [Trifolium repens]